MSEAKAMLAESLASRRLQGAPREIAAALSSLANVLQAEGNTATARDYQEQALVLFRAVGERAGEGICLINLGSLCSRQGQYDFARGYLEQAVVLGRSTGHGALEGMGESNLGEIHALEGDLASAHERYVKRSRSPAESATAPSRPRACWRSETSLRGAGNSPRHARCSRKVSRWCARSA